MSDLCKLNQYGYADGSGDGSGDGQRLFKKPPYLGGFIIAAIA